MRGGEKCLEALCELYPGATLFTLIHNRGSVSPVIESMDIRTSFVQKIPFAARHYRNLLPLFPSAIERLDMRGYDLVISSSHCVAKGVIPRPSALHLCYCHTPMRYIWSMYDAYFGPGRSSGIAAMVMPDLAKRLRRWDVASSGRVNYFIANSENVHGRIRRYYNRDAAVIHPPVDTAVTRLSVRSDGYYLIVSAFAPYKRIDLAVRAFNELGRKLVIVGTGQDEKSLKSIAGPKIEFIGWADSRTLDSLYSGCRALIFPGEEDFGIVPVEAQCYGKPVIAYGAGGVLETVKGGWAGERPLRGATGVFFREQTVGDLKLAVLYSESLDFDPAAIRRNALRFDRRHFMESMQAFIQKAVSEEARNVQAR
ncbi:glycosyltransferase [bacterium]|nr:glycosyltransferase [bacterium]